MEDLRASLAWLDEPGPGQSTGRCQRIRAEPPLSFCEKYGRNDRDAFGRERSPHGHLVHADRGGGHTGADVRHVKGLQVTLDHPVLAVWPVHHGKHDVEPFDDRRRGPRPETRRPPGRSSTSTPSAVSRSPMAGPSCSRPPARAATACSTARAGGSRQRPSLPIPMATGRNRVARSPRMTPSAEAEDTSCSADGPPNSTPAQVPPAAAGAFVSGIPVTMRPPCHGRVVGLSRACHSTPLAPAGAEGTIQG